MEYNTQSGRYRLIMTEKILENFWDTFGRPPYYVDYRKQISTDKIFSPVDWLLYAIGGYPVPCSSYSIESLQGVSLCYTKPSMRGEDVCHTLSLTFVPVAAMFHLRESSETEEDILGRMGEFSNYLQRNYGMRLVSEKEYGYSSAKSYILMFPEENAIRERANTEL